MHHGNQDRVRRDRAPHIIGIDIGIDAAERIDRHVRDLRPEPFQKSAWADACSCALGLDGADLLALCV